MLLLVARHSPSTAAASSPSTRSAQNSADAAALASGDGLCRATACHTPELSTTVPRPTERGHGQHAELVRRRRAPRHGRQGTITSDYIFAQVGAVDTCTRSATAKWGDVGTRRPPFPSPSRTARSTGHVHDGNATTPSARPMIRCTAADRPCMSRRGTSRLASARHRLQDLRRRYGCGRCHGDRRAGNTGTAAQPVRLHHAVRCNGRPDPDLRASCDGRARSCLGHRTIGSGDNGDYTIIGFAGFHVTGWSVNGSNDRRSVGPACTVPSAAPGAAMARAQACIHGDVHPVRRRRAARPGPGAETSALSIVYLSS